MSYEMTAVPIREVGEQSGDNWGQSSTDHLRDLLADMEAALRIVESEGSQADFDRWELTSAYVDTDPADEIGEAVNNWPLDVEIVTSRSLVADSSTVEQVRFLLTYGGPNVWLEMDYRMATVRLVRRWAGDRSDAGTVGQSAFDLAERFVRAFFYIEELER